MPPSKKTKVKFSGVYSITSRATGRIYVGSSVDLRDRLAGHLRELRRGNHENPRLQNHVNKYGLDDLVFEVLEEEPNRTLRFGLEQLLITALYGDSCFNLAKDVASSMSGRPHSAAARAKMSVSQKKKAPTTQETRARMRAAHLGKTYGPPSPETVAKISRALTGKVLTPEHRANVSAAGMGRVPTADTRAKLRAAKIGQTHTAEARAKMSASHKNRPPVSPETRLRMAVSQKLRWDKARKESVLADV